MFELSAFCETCLQAKAKGNIQVIVDESDFITPCNINIDGLRLRQIFDNLLDNAIKFTEIGYIRFGYRKLSEVMLQFVVEDTGIGISEAQLKVIFERFRQADLENTRRYGGTGIGLTIARNLIQLMGGDVWVDSTENMGTSFYFTVPYAPVEE
jgi:signal transduction histidine kinase